MMMVMMMAMMMAMARTHLPSDPQVSLDPDGKAEGGRVVFQGGGGVRVGAVHLEIMVVMLLLMMMTMMMTMMMLFTVSLMGNAETSSRK